MQCSRMRSAAWTLAAFTAGSCCSRVEPRAAASTHNARVRLLYIPCCLHALHTALAIGEHRYTGAHRRAVTYTCVRCRAPGRKHAPSARRGMHGQPSSHHARQMSGRDCAPPAAGIKGARALLTSSVEGASCHRLVGAGFGLGVGAGWVHAQSKRRHFPAGRASAPGVGAGRCAAAAAGAVRSGGG